MKTKLVIFGITGDLSTRKLLPALSKLVQTGEYDDLSIIGASRRDPDLAELLGDYRAQLECRTTIVSMDLTNADDYERLKSHISLQDDEQLLIYLSVPPSSSEQIVTFLGKAGLNTPNVKLLLEKPFGFDLASATAMIDHVASYYDESQVYRIDHYLAKEMAQNIVIFRSSNALFSHAWNGQSIEKIEIIAAEEIGIEGRAAFYEQTGALRDLIQGHLMQLLALTILDVKDGLDWAKLPKLRAQALEHVTLAGHPSEAATRGQYEGYREEVGNDRSMTETYASVTLKSHDPIWEGTKFVLTTGKALDRKYTEVCVHFRKTHDEQANTLTFAIQPESGIWINVAAKKPGYDREYESKHLGFSYADGTDVPDGYELVLVEAIRSSKSLFASSTEVLRSWNILESVQTYWAVNDSITSYSIGDKSII